MSEPVPVLSPHFLRERIAEFRAIDRERDGYRWSLLGVGLAQERRRCAERLLTNVAQCREHPQHWAYWDELYQVYRELDAALAIPAAQEDELRVYAAKAVFRAEEIKQSSGPGGALPHGTRRAQPVATG